MKKIVFCIISLLIVFPLGVHPITANVSEKDEQEIIEEEINIASDRALKEADVTELSELSNQQQIKLMEEVNGIKENHKNFYAQNDQLSLKSNAPYYGDLFLTLDEKTFTIRHGHAGIGYYTSGSVIESNPGDGVTVYHSRIDGYWRRCSSGGIYGVHGATQTQYKIATDYAYNREGRPYGFDPIGDDFYCSELVYYAWAEAGYDLDHDRVWGALIFPLFLMMDSSTYVREAF